MRVIAAMLRLDLDNFVSRSVRERKRKAGIFAFAAAVMVSIAGGVVWYNIRQTQERMNLAASQNDTGMSYRVGASVVKDYAKAMQWYLKAAEQGNYVAQHNIAFMYKNGLGVPQDYSKAAEFYQLAAENGDVDAQYSLGLLYLDGLGVSKDIAKARYWLEKAGLHYAE